MWLGLLYVCAHETVGLSSEVELHRADTGRDIRNIRISICLIHDSIDQDFKRPCFDSCTLFRNGHVKAISVLIRVNIRVASRD